ncbi:DNA repair protein RadA [Cellulosilyticum sp. ST5]|uniref:DNA repair protein RadA n=1 Tax=Cellulosilyticum lentocellum (strain ATCC 49066 / DSM 5427 / NCIMB 11756 / RHM5) TaxID=642492 RepID=F2JMQ6_CELLD|nr:MULTISPECIES: DNA repair protein RadA [Cellulosilyticum]ADZ84707.1 DNA repair protein RadA [Cellulosilyticum lentocellum DSM 5427]QEH70174.1 DNA repair protein RadA [Cellulosilyticum sp. WCF-2]
MAKAKQIYVCTSCGQVYSKWQGKCDACKEWNTIEEQQPEPVRKTGGARSKGSIPTKRLVDVESSTSARIITGISEFNRVMGGGIVKDSLTIITARPGAGKSTLLLQVAQDVANQGMNVLYASGEESDSQIKNRAERILESIHPNIWIHSDVSMNHVLDLIEEVEADLIIIDSIQTFIMEEYNSRPGSPVQTMECANALLQVAKNGTKPRAIIIVGQMTKDDEIAGVRALEHLVDAVLIIEGESGEELRGVIASKNRFGSTGEAAFFAMTERGMEPIENPSEYFMTMREKNEQVSGSALTVVREGSRPIIVEIESLVSTSFTPYPARISENMKREQLNTLISILEQRGKVQLYDKNVVVKTTGGLKLKEQAVNLAVVMSVVSSEKGKGIPSDTIFIADIGLTGELKRVPTLEARLKEADRMGYKKAYVARKALQREVTFKNLQVIEKNTLSEVIWSVFEERKDLPF